MTEATQPPGEAQPTEAPQPSEEGKPPENSAAFNQLLGYLADPHTKRL